MFHLLTTGLGVTAIASQLASSAKTISTHKTHVLKKLNLASVAELVR